MHIGMPRIIQPDISCILSPFVIYNLTCGGTEKSEKGIPENKYCAVRPLLFRV